VATGTIIVKDSKLPLGRDTGYPQDYAPDVLYPIARAGNREALGLTSELPFRGTDVWNAWELTWLGPTGCPVVAKAEIRVPADSPNIIESKSLKLYLNSFSMSTFESVSKIRDTIAADLAACAGMPVNVYVMPIARIEARSVSRLAGVLLDNLAVKCTTYNVDPGLLTADPSDIVREDLHTHLLRSLCPVTAQPDIGSVQISYRGPRIDHAGLLRYIVSYRQHSDFHESCIERMFVDLLAQCAPLELTLQAHYLRRGGIDINPFRTNADEVLRGTRLWRQ
jgi:7-cyano-7-deazaguanine reductase